MFVADTETIVLNAPEEPMTPHQTLAVAVRLFAIWLVLYVLPGTYTAVLGVESGSPDIITLAAIGIVPLVIAVLLWFFPLTVAGKLLSNPSETPSTTLSPDQWLPVGCTLIGVWLLASALPHIIQNTITLTSGGVAIASIDGFWPWLAYSVAELVVALWLILGNDGIVRLFRWARTHGTGKTSS